jgi:hypothetical protein
MLRCNITPVSLYPQATQERLAKGAGPGHIHNLWLRCEYRTVRPANALKAAGIEFANGKRLRARLRDAADGPNFWGQLFIDLRASLSLVGLIQVGALPNPPGLDSTRDMDRAFGPRYREEARQRAMQLQPVIAELKGRGLSLAKIASELNKRKVPTPRGGRWDETCCSASPLEHATTPGVLIFLKTMGSLLHRSPTAPVSHPSNF